MSRRPNTFIAVIAAGALALLAAPPASAKSAKAKKKPPVAARADDAPEAVIYGRRDDVMRFGADVAARHGWDAAWVQDALAAARYQPSVAKYIMPPPTGTAKN